MNVLQIIPSMHPNSGGTSQGIRNMIPELAKMGVHNDVVCIDDPAESFLGKDPFTIIALGPARGPWQYSSKLVPWLVEHMGRYDVVIINALWLYHGYAFIKALNIYSKKLTSAGLPLKHPKFYVMPHGMLDPYFQKAEERKLKALRNWAYWKLIESKLVNAADGLLFTCKTELMLARDPFRPYHPRKEINIGYGAEAPPPYESKMKTAFMENCPGLKDQPFILYLSRIHEKKGIDLLIEAYTKILNETKAQALTGAHTFTLPKLVIAGPGLNTPYGEKIHRQATASDLPQESIFFPGMLSGDAKWGAFYTAEAFVLPSHQENFGIAVVEALACGTPVLISNQVNIWREIFETGGGLVEEDTAAGTEKLLRTWIQFSMAEKDAMRKRARETFQEHFTMHHAAKRFLELLQV